MRWLVVPTAMVVVVALGLPATADHGTRTNASKMEALGHSPHAASFSDPSAERHVSSDLAFWGNLAFQGNYNGWRTIDISNPADPQELAWYNQCNGDQGDLVVWGHLLVRTWNSPADAGRTCGGEPVPEGWEGIHIFDIRDPVNPVLAGKLELPCGSHTATMAGLQKGKLIVYSNNSSSSGCADGEQVNDDPDGDFMDIISIPLRKPGAASLVHREPLEGPVSGIRTGCHDVGVIRLGVNKAACASADMINVFDIGKNATPGGSLTDPVFLFGITEPGVGVGGRWHSAAFTWDGAVLVAGWEPGGGGQAECEAGDDPVKKTMFFYDANTGAKVGQWMLPNPQGSDENCTIHNYNVVRLTSDRYIVVGGHYQGGTWAVDFTNPAAPETVAWSDPPSLGPGPFCDPDGDGPMPPECQLGGAWSSYWYNGYVYESDITKGLNVFSVNDPRLADDLTVELPFLNPQTQMNGPRCKGELATIVGSIVADVLIGTKGDDVVMALSGKDKIRTGRGNDLICAKGGKDTIRAGGGKDRAFGQGGRDRVYMQGGHDVLGHGGGGRDIVKGQGGDDRLNGAGGRDRCVGGAGIDTEANCETVVTVP